MILCDMLSCLQKVLNFSEIKLVPKSETILLANPYFENTILNFFYYLISTEPIYLLYNKEFAVVIYYIKIMLVISGKDISSYTLPHSS